MDGREDAMVGENLGWRLETIVFIELLRRNKPLERVYIPLLVLGGGVGNEVDDTFGEDEASVKQHKAKPYLFPGRSGADAMERKRRVSIFRFRPAHRCKSFGIAADAEMTNVLPSIWVRKLGFRH